MDFRFLEKELAGLRNTYKSLVWFRNSKSNIALALNIRNKDLSLIFLNSFKTLFKLAQLSRKPLQILQQATLKKQNP
jgi:hypothetical protein